MCIMFDAGYTHVKKKEYLGLLSVVTDGFKARINAKIQEIQK